MGSAPGSTGTLEAALQRIAALVRSQPALAAEQASAILRSVPGHPSATLFLGMARRQLGDLAGAIASLEPLASANPGSAAAHYELGVTLGLAGRREAALQSLRQAVALKADIGDAWRLIADHLMEMGDPAGADAAYANHLAVATGDARLLAPAAALCDNRLADADALLRSHLAQNPNDVAALRMLAEVATRAGRFDQAEGLLRRCLEIAPDFTVARYNYAVVLLEQNRAEAALAELERLLAAEPCNPSFRNLQANVLSRTGDYDRAIVAFEAVLADYPGSPRIWMAYGDALKAAGRQPDCITAYRRSIELAPGFGEAWWSLANLKTFRFAPGDVAAMHAQVARHGLPAEDRLHFHFALGKALEDSRRYADSFAHYGDGNRIRRARIAYDAEATSEYVRRTTALLTAEFLDQRRDWGCPAADPIFIVGLPRSGSTLIEQILASHPAVEGTMELPDVVGIARSLVGRRGGPGPAKYPDVLAALDATEVRALGERYLHQTRVQRKSGRPFFIDKMPNNWMHVGLIHLMLPNAKIIDARRHPLSCCFSAFKQHFARGQLYTYSLEDIGRYYRDYVTLMSHVDTVLPGRVHCVYYERLVEDTEGEVRRLLAHCGLPFVDACLRFHETERTVSTASSEQVRRPIFRDALEQWRHYEQWLDPLKQALGPVLDAYPAAPGQGA